MNRQTLKKLKLPHSPGVYYFVGRGRKILYIGRATSLKNRVGSYFTPDIAEKRGEAIAHMVREAKGVEWEATDSVLEALILEANLIKKYQPKYNVKEKDDKSFNYIIITKEDFPRVLLIRGRELSRLTLHPKPYTLAAVFGPFPRGSILRDAMKIVRKIFPFRDICTVGQGKPCFNTQIGLCPGVCMGKVNKKEYRITIQHLIMFLGGKKKALIKTLEKEMRRYAKKREFEKAENIKRTVFALKHVQDVSLLKSADARGSENADDADSARFRIEAYDVAHISGKAMVGVMTVVLGGEPEKGEYRKFKIKTVAGADDTASLAEVLRRRFEHPEWQYPRIIVVDGGVAQKNRAERVLAEMGIKIPIVSVVKDERHRPRNILGDGVIVRKHEHEILRANAEAHRFAITYHKKVRSSELFGARK